MDLTGWMFRRREEERRRAAESEARVAELEAALAAAKTDGSRALDRLRADLAKRETEAIGDAVRARDNRIRELEAAFAVRDADVDSLLISHQKQRARIAELEAEIARRDESVGDLRTRLAEARERIREAKESGGPGARDDDLTRIRGIGRVLRERLGEAGIRTFRQLAETPPEELLRIAKLPAWSIANPDDWIEQAREFSGSAGAPAQEPAANPSFRGSLPPARTPVSGSRRITWPPPIPIRSAPVTTLTRCPRRSSSRTTASSIPASTTTGPVGSGAPGRPDSETIRNRGASRAAWGVIPRSRRFTSTCTWPCGCM